MAYASSIGLVINAPSGLLVTKGFSKIKVEPNPVDGLIKIRDAMGKDSLQGFKRRYGDILDLLTVPVQKSVLMALGQHWNNQLRCFVFSQFHLSLVVEEYAGLLRMPLRPNSAVYTYPGHLPSWHAVAKLLGVSLEALKILKKGGAQVIPLDFLMSYMDRQRVCGNQMLLHQALALAIYGTVLFPSAYGMIDLHATSIFMAVENYRVNPVPAILADTYASLSYCQAKKSGKLWCCLQLLIVWMANHLCAKEVSRGVRFDDIHHPLSDFNRREGACMADTTMDWGRYFGEITHDRVRWKLVWWEQEEVLYSCGEYSNVPLVSARGVINYNPAMAHMQLGYAQRVPSEELIQPVYFSHGIHFAEENAKVTRAWADMRFKGRAELGVRNIRRTLEYVEWMKELLTDQGFPACAPQNPLLGNDRRQVERALLIKIEEYKLEIENKREELKRFCDEIRRKEEEYASTHRAVSVVEKKRKIMAAEDPLPLREKIGKLEEELTKKESELEEGNKMIEALHKETEYMADKHIRNVENMMQNQVHLEEEVEAMRCRHHETKEWMNMAAPCFSENLWKAEKSMANFYMTPELKEFFRLSKGVVEAWNELGKSI